MLGPIPMNAREVRLLLLEMARLAGDRHSFEGNLAYSAMDGPPCSVCHGAEQEEGEVCEHCEGYGEPLPDGADFWVTGVIRDNSDGGQGFVKIIGTMLDNEGRALSGLS